MYSSRPRALSAKLPNPFLNHGRSLKSNKALSAAFSFHGLLVVLTCGGYLGASSLLILLNKFLLAKDGFSFPLMLSGSGMLFTLIGSSIMVEMPGIVPERQIISKQTFVSRILPLGFCSAATLALGNMAYLHLEVGLIQMLKSCCPVFVLFVALAFRLETFSVPLVSSIVLIAAGTATTAASGVTAVSLLGLLIQFSSELCEAFRLCLAQILMCNMKLHQFEALKQMSAACVLFLTVGIWSMEWQRFREQKAWERVISHPHWYIAAEAMHRNIVTSTHENAPYSLAEQGITPMPACLGFMLNLLAFAVIKLTGSLTQKVLGTAKNVMLVVFSVFVMGEQVSWKQAVGYQVSLLGFCWYQYQKMTIAARIAAQQQQQSVLPTSHDDDFPSTKASHGPLSPMPSRRLSKSQGLHSRQDSVG